MDPMGYQIQREGECIWMSDGFLDTEWRSKPKKGCNHGKCLPKWRFFFKKHKQLQLKMLINYYIIGISTRSPRNPWFSGKSPDLNERGVPQYWRYTHFPRKNHAPNGFLKKWWGFSKFFLDSPLPGAVIFRWTLLHLRGVYITKHFLVPKMEESSPI